MPTRLYIKFYDSPANETVIELSSLQAMRCNIRADISRWRDESLWKHCSSRGQECEARPTRSYKLITDHSIHLDKDKWIDIERKRWAKAFKIPISEDTPKPFPQPTLNTQRALCAIEISHPDKLSDAFASLYQAFWVEGKTIGKPEAIAPALQKVFGEAETKTIIEKMSSPEAKKRLSENSDAAMAEGAFGLPWFVATNAQGEKESFW